MKYNPTSLAYDISENNEISEIVSEVRKEHTKKRKNSFLFTFICGLYIVCLVSSLLVKTAKINEERNALDILESQYNEILNDNKKIEVSINSQIDLRKVEEIAIATLNMNRPKKSQTVYVNTQPKDYGEVIETTESAKESHNVLAILVKSIGGIFSYSK